MESERVLIKFNKLILLSYKVFKKRIRIILLNKIYSIIQFNDKVVGFLCDCHNVQITQNPNARCVMRCIYQQFVCGDVSNFATRFVNNKYVTRKFVDVHKTTRTRSTKTKYRKKGNSRERTKRSGSKKSLYSKKGRKGNSRERKKRSGSRKK